MKKINYIPWIAAAGLAASLVVALPAFAQTSVGVAVNANVQTGGKDIAGLTAQGSIHNGANGGVRRGGPGMTPGVFGTVTAINGTTLTVTSKGRPNSTSTTATAATVYTVDAGNATVYKGSATSTVSISSIATGDTVMVQGTVSGTTVTATTIRDGVGGMMGGQPGAWGKGGMHGATSTMASPITGNGEPVVGGSITAINGTTLTVTNTSNVTYTIDASAATIVKNGTSTAITNLSTGDNVIVQGTVNGTSVTASSVIDQGVKAGASGSATSTSSHGGGFGAGFFGAIGGFFAHLFGF
jgi:Domain of unknown function (DUF5666)